VQIFDALLRRDAALSSALMVTHLRGAMSYWSELLEPVAGG
jgi:GntR family transcriptional repressor for pyruvate dehydrogenase complex